MTNHWPHASLPLIHGSRGLRCRLSPLKDIVCKLRNVLMFYGEINYFSYHKMRFLAYQTGSNRIRSEQLMNADHKSPETVFSIANCSQSGDKRQLKTLFLKILDLRSLIALKFSIVAYPKCLLNILIRSQNNLKQGLLGIIYNFHVSVKKIILFPHRIGDNRKGS